MTFPQMRPRRLRENAVLRDMLSENRLAKSDLIYPMFVKEGLSGSEPISSMPGQFRWGLDALPDRVAEVSRCGVQAVIIFGIPQHKDEEGSQAYAEDGIVQQAMRIIKKDMPEMLIIGDVCLCEYTSHGHCGMVSGRRILNDPTLELLSAAAVSQARAGADLIAPSDMMDGRIAAIRHALDSAGFDHLPIMSYAAKYASSYYGPFREAAGSAPGFGDRRSYQMNPANSDEALREVRLDVEEGADIVMVKPALAYLDIVRRVKDRFTMPVAAYAVSGEYAMIEAAAANGWIDRRRTIMETLLSIRRAGADLILTYHAPEAAVWLDE